MCCRRTYLQTEEAKGKQRHDDQIKPMKIASVLVLSRQPLLNPLSFGLLLLSDGPVTNQRWLCNVSGIGTFATFDILSDSTHIARCKSASWSVSACVMLKYELSIARYIRNVIHSCLEYSRPESAAERLRLLAHRVAKYGRSMAKSGCLSLGALGSRLWMWYACWARCHSATTDAVAEALTTSSEFVNFSKSFTTRGTGLDVLNSFFFSRIVVRSVSVKLLPMSGASLIVDREPCVPSK